MRHVRQEDEWGCGVAVLAMLTNQRYQDVDVDFPYRLTEHWPEHSLEPHHMESYLMERGWFLRRVRDRRYAVGGTWPSLRPFAAAHYAMVDSPTQPTGHWVAIDDIGVVFDPFDAARKTLAAYPAMHEVVGLA